MLKLKNKLISGAFLLCLGTFVAKVLGAVYRIPLTRFLGAEGIGVYQMVFPVYALLLDFSGSALPNGLAKTIAQNKNRANEYLKVAIKTFFKVGLVGSVLLVLVSFPLSKLQATSLATACYITLAPAVFLVSLISCYRGFFQGKLNMLPTATSQIIEQAVKLVLGLSLCYVFRRNLQLALILATTSVTVSELVAFIYLRAKFKVDKEQKTFVPIDKIQDKTLVKQIIKSTFPITLLGLILPFSQILDGIITVNILGRYLTNATALYGLLSGVCLTVINLPVSICHGIATVTIPTLSGERENPSKRAGQAFILTLAVSLPCVFFCMYFSPFIIKVLFGSLSATDKQIASGLIKTTSFAIVFLSLLQTGNAVLIGLNCPKLPIISLSVGVIIKTLLSITLLKDKRLNIYGGAIALIACYFFACLVNLILIIAKENGYARKTTVNRRQNA